MVKTLFLLLATGCAQPLPPVKRVVVRDQNFQVVRTLEDPTSLKRFTELWSTREKSPAAGLGATGLAYKLDIATDQSSGRWLYRADGSTALLSIKATDTYVVREHAALNTLLGIEGSTVARTPPNN